LFQSVDRVLRRLDPPDTLGARRLQRHHEGASGPRPRVAAWGRAGPAPRELQKLADMRRTREAIVCFGLGDLLQKNI